MAKFNRDKWLVEKAAREVSLATRFEELAGSIITDPDALSAFGKAWCGGFHSYSMYNTLWAMMQRGGEISVLASHKKWETKGRTVRKGEKAVYVWAPITFKAKVEDDDDKEPKRRTGFRLVPVFDYAQTEGDEIELGNPGMSIGTADFGSLSRLAPVPVDVECSTIGTDNGWTDGETITVRRKDSEAAMVATLLHEWAHVALKHTESRGARDIQELEAEAVAYLVCDYIGIDNKRSALYIGGWAGKDAPAKMAASAKRVLRTAEGIIKTIAQVERAEAAA